MLKQIKKLFSKPPLQQPAKQISDPLAIREKLTEAELEAIAGARLFSNHNETIVSAEDIVLSSPTPVEMVKLTQAHLEAIAGAGLSRNHNETIVSAEEVVLSSSTAVEMVKLTQAHLEAIAAGTYKSCEDIEIAL